MRVVERVATRSSALAAVSPSVSTGAELAAADKEFLLRTELMLTDGHSNGMQSRFTASATDASYDFNEYVFLRNADDPFSPELTSGGSQIIPSDPRYKRFLREGENAVASLVEYASLGVQGTIPAYLLTVRMNALRSVLTSWWISVCAIRGFNRLGRFSRSEIKQFSGYSPEQFYGAVLSIWLGLTAYADVQRSSQLGDWASSAPVNKLLTVAVLGRWTEIGV